MKLPLLLFLALVCTAMAGERAALLIGNAKYRSNQLPALDTPPLDVKAMEESLLAAHFNVTVETDLTTAEMRKKVVEFTRAHSEAEALLIYVSGHGLQVDGENYLPGVDADLDVTAAVRSIDRTFPGMTAEERAGKELDVVRFTAEKQMVPLRLALDALAATAQGAGRVRMIFLDTCRSPFKAPASKGMLGGKSGGGMAPVNERPGLFIGFAALANQDAQQNEAGHPSLFTEALASQMRQPGLELEQVFRRTRKAVTERSRELKSKGLISEEQTPASYSVLEGDFVFLPETITARAEPVPAQPAAVSPKEALRAMIALAKPAPVFCGTIRVKNESASGGVPLTISLEPDLRSGTMTQSSRRGNTIVKFNGVWDGAILRAVSGEVVAEPSNVKWEPESFTLRFSDDGKTAVYECDADKRIYLAELSAQAGQSAARAKPAQLYKGIIHAQNAPGGPGIPLTIKLEADGKSGAMTQTSKRGDTVVKFSGVWDGITLRAVTGEVVSKPHNVRWEPESFSLRFSEDGATMSYECRAGDTTYMARLAAP